jgi:hypothetical protein
MKLLLDHIAANDDESIGALSHLKINDYEIVNEPHC